MLLLRRPFLFLKAKAVWRHIVIHRYISTISFSMEDLKSNPQQLQRRRLGRQVAVNLDYMLSSVCFPSINDAKFRFISTSDGESVILKIEKVKAPQQWQVVVKELSKHGPNGLPKEAVMMGLKVREH